MTVSKLHPHPPHDQKDARAHHEEARAKRGHSGISSQRPLRTGKKTCRHSRTKRAGRQENPPWRGLQQRKKSGLDSFIVRLPVVDRHDTQQIGNLPQDPVVSVNDPTQQQDDRHKGRQHCEEQVKRISQDDHLSVARKASEHPIWILDIMGDTYRKEARNCAPAPQMDRGPLC